MMKQIFTEHRAYISCQVDTDLVKKFSVFCIIQELTISSQGIATDVYSKPHKINTAYLFNIQSNQFQFKLFLRIPTI